MVKGLLSTGPTPSSLVSINGNLKLSQEARKMPACCHVSRTPGFCQSCTVRLLLQVNSASVRLSHYSLRPPLTPPVVSDSYKKNVTDVALKSTVTVIVLKGD